jgi:hypothetical protein
MGGCASEPVKHPALHDPQEEEPVPERSGYRSDLSLPNFLTTPPLAYVLAVSQGALNAEMLRYLDEQQFQ